MDNNASYAVIEDKWIQHPAAILSFVIFLLPSGGGGELGDYLECHQLEKEAKMPHQPLNAHQRGTNFIYRVGEWGLMFKQVLLNLTSINIVNVVKFYRYISDNFDMQITQDGIEPQAGSRKHKYL